MIVVIDSNVPIVANEKSKQASSDCVKACVQRIKKVVEEDQLLLDNNWQIIREYLANLNSQGDPGVGDRFLKWVLNNRATGRCIYVPITPLENDSTNFKEFPSDPRLIKFDPSDRKFVAVAMAHPEHPPVLNAVDTDWWFFKSALEDNGVNIEFLCEADIMLLVRESQ